MASALSYIFRILGLSLSKAFNPFPRSIDTNFSIFREGDRAVVQGKSPFLTKPIKAGHQTNLRRGILLHNDIIGRRVRDPVKAHKGPEYRLSLPTLEEYIHYTPRLVTPIYAADANLIISLLDIHVSPPSESQEKQPSLEILEAGTGHGSLTLHLSRAIHAANSNPPSLPARSQVRILQDRPIRPDAGAEEKHIGNGTGAPGNDQVQQQWDVWRAQRRAVIHTVDVSSKFSNHAEKIVRGFRRGIYAGNVDFHVGPVEAWIANRVQERQMKSGLLSFEGQRAGSPSPFLDHAILDMPSAHLRIPNVAPVLRRDGTLAVFMPNVTQIGDCVQLIHRQNLPFVLERAVELGTGLSSGRLWDVRLAMKKSRADPSSWAEQSAADSKDGCVSREQNELAQPDQVEDALASSHSMSKEENPVLVCRPKVGLKIVGGGFVGIWRRIENSSYMS